MQVEIFLWYNKNESKYAYHNSKSLFIIIFIIKNNYMYSLSINFVI